MGKGLRQGDPLAPFLFLVVAEGLEGVVKQSVSKGILQSVEVGENKVKVNMLHYVDDTMFLCKNSIQNVMALEAILCYFELAPGLKVNCKK